MSERVASLEAAIQQMERERREQAKLVADAIKRNFTKRNVDEDELLRDVEAVLAPSEEGAESDEHITPSVADTDEHLQKKISLGGFCRFAVHSTGSTGSSVSATARRNPCLLVQLGVCTVKALFAR